MSFNCDECGKNLVDRPGEWCSECQKREALLWQEDQARWFSKSALCQTCNNAEGPDPSDNCSAYNMPLRMVARKKKCKRYAEYNWKLERDIDDFMDYNEYYGW